MGRKRHSKELKAKIGLDLGSTALREKRRHFYGRLGDVPVFPIVVGGGGFEPPASTV